MKTAALVALGIFICVAGGTSSGNTGASKCSGYCKDSTKFKYLPGHTYVYDYRIDTSTGISETSREESRLHLATTAEISVISQCDFRLQLRDVALEDSLPDNVAQHSPVPGMAELAEALERHPLHFSFQDGKVEELCPNADDDPWVMNIKRGVLSVFQNSMSSLDMEQNVVYERDVTGLCETTYTSSRTALATVVTKSKDLLSCTNRLDHYHSLQSTPYNSPVNVHSLPLVKSQHSCKQIIGATGLIERAICSELHLFRPFSNGENGANTKVSQYLILKQIISGVQPEISGTPGPRTTLLYHHRRDDYLLQSQEQTVMLILENLDEKTKYGVEGDVPHLFAQLVTELRTLRYIQLDWLFFNTKQPTLRKFLLDAVSLVATPDSIMLMTELHIKKLISDAELDTWLTSLSFQKKPSLGILEAISAHLENSPRPKAILSASTLVHSYCQTNTDCDNEIVKNIIRRIEHLLGGNCQPKDEEHMNLIIIALKGIGNAGIVVDSLKTLKRCYEANNPIEVRLAAIDAYRRLPCDVAPRLDLLDIYTNMRGDTEIRIAAYLAAMQCPSTQTFRYVKDILYKEEVNQVASFVWTHLTNMQETSSRWKQGIKSLISNEFLKNKFSTDVRKFSRNYEASTYFDSINAGAAIESNVIFTPQSYLPRSAMLNLTLDLFGESFNVFEIGGRAEGFEQTIENIFGPGGYFPDETVEKFLNNYKDRNDNQLEESIDKLSASFDVKKKMKLEPEASIYARVFGNEFLYSKFKGFEKFLEGYNNSSYKDYLMKFVLGEGTEYMNSFSLLDASYIIPTVAGLPLEFAVNGTATVGLKYGGLMNIRESGQGSMSFSGELIPSAAMEIIGTMSVRVFTAKAGIISVNKLNTNTYLGGAVKIMKGKIVDVKINFPREKMEILDVSTKLFMLHREVQNEMKGILQDREYQQGCSPDFISDILGLKLCGELSYPNASQALDAPHFPLTGPFSSKLSLFKTDNFSMYDFSYIFNPGSKVSSVNIKFDTAGSQIDRKIQFLGVYDRKKSSVNVNLRTPVVRLSANGMVTINSDVKRIDGGLSLDNTNFFEIHIGFERVQKMYVNYYKPILTLVYKDKTLLDLRGAVHYIDGVKYSADLKLKSQYKPVFIRGDLKLQNQGYFVSGIMNSSFINGKLEGAVRKVSDYISSHAKIQYAIEKAEEQSIEITNKMLLSTKGDAELKSVQASAKFSEFPEFSFDVSWELRRAYRLFLHSLTWTLGNVTWETSQVYRHQYLQHHVDFQLLGLLSCQQKGIDYKVDIKHQTTDSSILSHSIVHLGADHKYIASFEYLYNARDAHTLAMELSYSGFNATIDGRLVESLPHNYEFSVDGSLNMKKKLRLSGTYSDHSNEILQDHNFQMQLTGELNGELFGTLQVSEESIKQSLQLLVCGQKFQEDITYTYNGLHNFDIELQLAKKTYKGSVIISNTNKEKGVTIALDFTTKLTFTGKISNRHWEDFDTIELELTWNKTKYPQNRIYLIAESVQSKSSFSLEFPGQHIKGELVNHPGSVESRLQWQPNKIITATLKWKLSLEEAKLLAKLETPWRGLEKQALLAQHKVNRQNALCQVELSWQKENFVFLATGEKTLKRNNAWTLDAKLKFTTSLKQLINISLAVDHAHGEQIESNIQFLYGSQNTTLNFKHQSTSSDIVVNFSLDSSWLKDPLKSKLTLRNDDHAYRGSIELIWAPHKEITGNFVWLRDSQFSTLLQLVTPFEGYESFITELRFKTQNSNMSILGKVALNDNLYLLSLERTVSNEYKTYGKFMTPFIKTLEVNIHNLLNNNEEKDTFLIKYGNQEIMKLNTESVYLPLTRERKQDFSFVLNLPAHLTSLHISTIIGDKNSMFKLDGSWNTKTLSILLQGNNTIGLNDYVFHYHGKIFGSIVQAPIEMDCHHIQAVNVFNTTIQIPGGIFIRHILTYNHLFFWKNILNIQTPWKVGTIINMQNFYERDFKLMHSMTADIDGKHAEAHVTIIMNSKFEKVQEVEGIINTPWNHPITVHFLSDDKSETQLSINFKQKKFIFRNTRKFTLTEKFLMFQLESPYHEPINLSAGYDIASLTKKVLMKMQWAKKSIELNSEIKFDFLDGFAKLGVKSFNSDQEILKFTMTYNFEDEDAFIDIHGLIGENEIKAIISQDLRGLFDLKFTIRTLQKGWEDIQVIGKLDVFSPDKQALLQIIRNDNNFNISSSATWGQNSYIIIITTEDTLFGIPKMFFNSTLEYKSSNFPKIDMLCIYNETKTELSIHLDRDVKSFANAATLEIILKTPLEDLQFLMAHVSYDNKNDNNQKIKIILIRDDWKLQVDGDANFDNSGSNANLELILPFREIERLSASLSHSFVSIHEQTLNVLISLNDKKIEVDGSVVSNGNELLADMKLKTPINGYETITGNFNVIGIVRQQKSVSLSLLTRKHSLKLLGTLNITSLLHIDGKVKAEFPHTQQVATAGLSYNLLGDTSSRRYAELYLKLPTEKYHVIALINTPNHQKMTIELSIDTPQLVNELTGCYEFYQSPLLASINILKNKTDKVLTAEVKVHEDLLSFNFTCPSIGYEKLLLLAEIYWTTQTIILNFVKNGEEYKASLITNLDFNTIEAKLDIYTPIENWNEVNIHGKYNSPNNGEEIKLVVVKGEEYALDIDGRWFHGGEGIETSLNILQASFGTVGITGNITRDKYIARIKVEDNVGRKLLESNASISERNIHIAMESIFTYLQLINLGISYNTGDLINSEVKYRGFGSENVTHTSKFRVNNEMIFMEIDPFLLHPNYTSLSSTLLYKNVFINSVNPSVSLQVYIGGSKVLTTTLDFYLDWKNKLNIDYQFDSEALHISNFSVSAWVIPQYLPTNLHLVVKDQRLTWLDICSVKKNLIKDGFTYELNLTRLMKRDSLILQYYPQAIKINFTDNHNEHYTASAVFNTGNELNFDIALPIVDYDHFNLNCKYGSDFIDATLKTPFPDYKHLIVSGKLNFKEHNKKSINFFINKNDHVTGTDIQFQYGLNYAELSFNLITPFKSLEKFSYASQYDFRGIKRTGSFRLELNENVYKLASEVSLRNLSADGVLQIFTPIPELKNAKILINFDFLSTASKNLRVQGEKNYNKLFDLNLGLPCDSKKGKFILSSQLPLADVSILIAANYDFSDIIKGHNVVGSMELFGIKTNIALYLSGRKNQYNQGRFEASILENNMPLSMDMSLTLVNGKQEKKFEFVSIYQGKRSELKAVLAVDFMNKIELTLSSIFPSHGINSISIQWNKRINHHMDGKFEVNWKSTKVIQMQAFLERSSAGYPQAFTLALRSSFKNFKEFVLTFSLAHSNGLTMESTVRWGKGKNIILIGSFNFKPHKANNKISLTTSFSEPLILSLDFNLLSAEQSLDVKFGYGSRKLQMQVEYIPTANEVTLTVFTPFTSFKYIQLIGKFSIEYFHNFIQISYHHENYSANLVAQINTTQENKVEGMLSLLTSFYSQKIFSFNGTFTKFSELSSFVEMNWGDEEFVTASGALSPQSVSLKINTTFPSWENIDMDIIFIHTDDINRAQFSLRYGSEVIDTSATITSHIHGNSNIDVRVRTPWTETITLQGVHKLSDGHLIHLNAQHGIRSYQVQAKLNYKIDVNLYDYRFEAVLSDLGKLTIHTGYNKTPSSNKLFYKQEIGTLRLFAFLENNRSKQDMTTKFHLETPLKNLRTVNSLIELNFVKRCGVVMLDKNGDIYKIYTAVNLTHNHFGAQFNVQSPNFNIRNVTFHASFDRKSINMSVDVFGKRINMNGIFACQEDISAFYGLLELPFIAYLNQTSLSLNVDIKKLAGSFHGHWNGNDVSAIVNLNPRTLHLIAQTPFEMLKMIQFSGKFISTESDHQFTGFLEWEQLKLDLDFAIRMEINNFSILSNLKWNDKENILADVSLRIPHSYDDRVDFKFNFITPFETFDNISIISGYQATDNATHLINFLLSAPGLGFPNLQSSMFFSSVNSSLDVKLNSMWMNKELAITVIIKNDPEYFFANLDVLIPHNSIPPIKFNIKFNSLENTGDAQLHISDTLYTLSGSYVLDVDNLTMSLDFLMPTVTCQLSISNRFSDSIYKGETNFYVNNNRILSSYEIQHSSIHARLNLNIPKLTILESNIDIAADYSEHEMVGTITSNYLRHNMKAIFNLKKEPYSPWNGQNVIEYYLSRFYLKAEHSYGQLSRSGSIKIANNNEELSIVGQISTANASNKEASLVVKKKDSLTLIKILDWLNAELSFKTDSGFLILSYPKQIHKLHYSVMFNNGFEAIFDVESPLFPTGKQMVHMIYKNLNSVLKAKISIDAGSLHESASLDIKTKDNMNSVRIEVLSQNSRLLVLDSELYIEKESFLLKTGLDMFGMKHSIQLKHKLIFPLHTQVVIDMPSLLNKPVKVLLSTEDHLKAYAGYGETIDQKYIMLEAKLLQEDGKVNLTLHTPFLSLLKVLNFNGEYLRKVNSEKFSVSLSYLYNFDHSPIEAFFKYNFSNNLFYTHFKLRTPLKYHEHYEGLVHIPFIIDKNTHFNISLSLPYAKYLYSAALNQQGETVQFSTVLQHRDKSVNATFNLEYSPKFMIFTEINTPFSGLRHYCLNLKGQRSLKDGNSIVNYIEWDDERIELRYSFVIDVRKFIVQVELKTPFPNFDHYAMNFQYENHARKVMMATITYPGLEKPVGVEFDYLYNGIFDVNLVAQFRIPFFPRFQAASFLLGNKLDIGEGSYQAIASVQINERKLSLAIDGLLKWKEAKLEIQALQNDKEIYLKVLSTLDSNYKVLLSLELRTPIPIIKNIRLFSEYRDHELKVGTFYDSREILGLEIMSSRNSFNFELRNPIRSVSISYMNQFDTTGHFSAYICWNLNKRSESQLGIEYSSKILSRQRWELQSKLTVSRRIMSYNLISEHSVSKLEYAMGFSWDEGKQLGYHVLVYEDFNNSTIFGRVDLPFRSFEGSLQGIVNPFRRGVLLNKVEILWDAAGDRNKNLGFETLIHQNDIAELRVKYGFFAHDIVVKLENKFKKSSSFILDKRGITLIYSSNPEDIFKLETFYEYQYYDKFAMGIFVKHKPSKLHFDTSLEMSNNVQGMSSKLNITYFKSSTKETVNLISFGKVIYEQPEVELQFGTNKNNLGIHGMMWSQKKNYDGISVSCQMNQKEPLMLSAAVNTDKNALELKLSYGNKRHYALQGQFPNWQEISAKATHSLNDVTVTDGQAALRLNTSKLLWTQIQWSPKFAEDMKPTIIQEYEDIALVMNAIGQSYLELLSEEFQINLPLISLNDITDYTKLEFNVILKDFQAIGYGLSKMYERNDFFIKDISNLLKTKCTQLYTLLQAIGNSAAEIIETLYSSVKELLSYFWSTLSMDYFLECIKNLINDVQEMMKIAASNFKIFVKYIYRLEELLRESGKQILSQIRWGLHVFKQNLLQISQDLETILMKCINLLVKHMEIFIESIERQVSYIQVEAMVIVLEAADALENITATLVEIPEVQYLLDTYVIYSSWLEEFHWQEYLDSIVDFIAESIDALVNDVMDAVNKIKMMLIGSTQSYFDDVDQIPMIHRIKTFMNEIYQKCIWFWKYYEITNQVLIGLNDILEQSDTFLVDALANIDSDFESDSKTALVFQPDMGLVEYTQELPVEWNGFNELPKFEQFNWYPEKKSEQTETLDRYSYYITDPFNKTLNSVLPPFTKHAVIIGKKHFITFDNKFYEFEGECSYLLASDFLNNKFSAVINYEIQNHEVVKKSLTIIIAGHHIDIDSSNRVSVDGMKTELPVDINQSTWITRIGERILVRTKYGMALECNLYHDICTMELNGWYFGKTGGLLGTFDNEPSNDISLPDGTITTDIKSFAESWHVGKSSRCHTKAQVIGHREDLKPSKQQIIICSNYFQHPSSPLSPCFSHVEPQLYYEMCLQDMLYDRQNSCRSPVVYATQCRKSGVDVWVPPECVTCSLTDGKFLNAGEGKVFTENSPQSADVVLVVEQASCLKAVRIIDAVKKLDTSLKMKGLTDNRYSVVGFGGNSFHQPHTRTADSKIWTTSKSIEKALNGLQFTDGDQSNSVSVYDALWYAARLSFRGGVSKAIILLQCNSCDDQIQTNDYNDMLRLLQENYISLHIMQLDAVNLLGSPEKSARIFGMDMEGAYSGRNLANLTPKKNLLRQVLMPKDLCVPLALETNGTIFNLNHMVGERSQSTSKKFLDVWSRRLARDILPPPCQMCQCVVNEDFVGQMICSKCQTPNIDNVLEDLLTMWPADEDEYSDY